MNKFIINTQQVMACLYMLIFSLICTCLALLALSSIGLSGLLPFDKSLLLSSFLGLCLGLIKTKSLTHVHLSHKRAFILGLTLFLLILPLFDIGAVFMMKNQFHGTISFHDKITEYLTLYVVILIYSFLFIGSWLSLISGFIFVTLNRLINRRGLNKKMSYY